MRKVALRSFFCLITLLICHDHVLAVGLGVTAASQISLPDGFEAELVDEIPSDQQGPWGSLTVDPKGRLIASDQDGAKQFRTDNGRIVLGRVVKMSGDGLSVMTDSLDPSKRQVVQRNPVEVTEPAKVSMMPGDRTCQGQHDASRFTGYLYTRRDCRSCHLLESRWTRESSDLQ